MVFRERMDGASDTRVNDELREGQRGANGISSECEGRRRREEAVHDIVGVGREADEEEELGVVLDGANGALDPTGA